MDGLSLDDFALFTRIADTRSLSSVARERNVAASRISRALVRIEGACGLRLARRSTHGLSLTDEGRVFLEHAQRILAERGRLQDQLHGRREAASGVVRISVAQLLAEHVLIPRLPALRERHPALTLDLQLADRVADLAQEGIDIVVRAGIAPADVLVARTLGTHGRALYAAPAYLARHGTPRTPHELAQHSLVTNSASPGHNQWPFVVDGQALTLPVQGSVRVDNSAAVLSLALAGAGIARINDVLGRGLVQQGRLLPVLADCCVPGEYGICAAILAERHRAPKIRATMDFLQQAFGAFLPERPA